MARKSKQPGGHNPLTAHEVKRLKLSGYGTQTTRLSSTASHLPFGQCCLSLSPISTTRGGSSAAVATPSGHVYSREAIVQYLLTKNAELRSRRAEYDRLRSVVEERRAAYEEKRRSEKRTAFLTKDQGAMNGNDYNSATTALVLREDRQTTNDTTTTGSSSSSSTFTPLNNNSKRVENSLSHVSYWLASSQPSRANKKGDDDDVDDITEFDYLREIEALPPLPPSRPSSPMSGEPLRLKQLVPLHLSYEGGGSSSNSNEYDDTKSSSSSSSVSLTNNADRRRQQQQQSKKGGSVICSVSHKAITTQPIIALHGHVMLRDVYERYALPTLTCPITGRKFNVKKDVIKLVAGRSGYAASGMVVAKKYNPTLT